MAWSLPSEDRDDLNEQFLAIDKTNSGTISLDEFRDVLKKNFDIDSVEAERLFARIDVDSDHEIHYSDFLAAALQDRVRLHEDLLRTTFQRFDVDHTGAITAENLVAILGDEGSDVQDMLREVDVDRDGVISYEEFIEYLQAPDHSQTPNNFSFARASPKGLPATPQAHRLGMADSLISKALTTNMQNGLPLQSPMNRRRSESGSKGSFHLAAITDPC